MYAGSRGFLWVLYVKVLPGISAAVTGSHLTRPFQERQEQSHVDLMSSKAAIASPPWWLFLHRNPLTFELVDQVLILFPQTLLPTLFSTIPTLPS